MAMHVFGHRIIIQMSLQLGINSPHLVHRTWFTAPGSPHLVDQQLQLVQRLQDGTLQLGHV